MPAQADDLQDRHIEAARQRVAHLHALSHATDEAERKIGEAAKKRLAEVDAELTRLRPRAMLDEATGRRVEDLALERGHLMRVIAQAAARAPGDESAEDEAPPLPEDATPEEAIPEDKVPPEGQA